MDNLEKFIKQLIKSRVKTREELENLKRSWSKKTKTLLLSNTELLKAYHKLAKNQKIKKDYSIEKLLKTRPMRSLSGIVNITVLTKPFGCPGKCIFCPLEKGFPKSYLKGEPAADRAYDLNFDPFLQVTKRLQMLKEQGHPTDKIELRIVGGSWSFYSKNYQNWFIKRCFEAANQFNNKTKIKSANLKKTLSFNEKAKARIVGVSVETRPDMITPEELRHLRKLGITMVEIGAQTIFDDILKLNQTGLTSEIIALTTKRLKDAGFKVLYHLMPNLYGSDLEKDEKMFDVVFKDSRFQPDWLKIYPVVVLKNTKLFSLWEKGEYKPYSDEELKNLLIRIKVKLPYWVRVARIIRDIPAQKIVAGTKLSNLREIIQKEMRKKGLVCHCIRCREVKGEYDPSEKIYLFKEEYESANGKEIFLSLENKERTKLFSHLRLRMPSFDEKPIFKSLADAALLREIKTYGEMVPIDERKIAPQHRGLGKRLIQEAEKITKKEFKLKKLAVIAGIGVREYFRKLGYQLKDTYMIKNLD